MDVPGRGLLSRRRDDVSTLRDARGIRACTVHGAITVHRGATKSPVHKKIHFSETQGSALDS